MPILANATGFTLALLATFLGIGVVVNVIVGYIVGEVMAERRANQENESTEA